MKRLAVALIAISLSGCAIFKKPKPEVVYVPVAVPCKADTPASPNYRFHPPYDQVFEAVRDLLGDRELSKAYQIELEAALKACQK